MPAPKILEVDMMHGEVLVTFEGGRLALYSAALLVAMIGQACELIDVDPDADLQGLQ